LQAKLSLVKGVSQQDVPDLMAQSGEGIVSLDHKGRVQDLNAIANRLLGWSAEELRGADFFARSRFSLTQPSAPHGGARCSTFTSIACPHLNVHGRLTDRSGAPLDVSFVLLPVSNAGVVTGKLFVFTQAADTRATSLAQTLVEQAASIIVQLDANGAVRYSNPQAQWLLGDAEADALLPASIASLLRASPHLLDQQTLLDQRAIPGHEKELCLAWSVSVQRDAQGAVTGAICVGNDFTDHHHGIKGQLHELHETRLLAQAYDHISDGVIVVDRQARVTYLNLAAEQLTGWTQAEARGQPLAAVYQVLDERDLRQIEDPLRPAADNPAPGRNRVLQRRGGWEFIVTDQATSLCNAAGEEMGAVLVFRDVSELRGMERRLAYEASHDRLTGLINRAQFEQRLALVLEQARASGGHHALLYVDLDLFKLVNDSYGHAAGDQLLKEMSSLLLGQLSEGDCLARLGGDEFGVILKNCPPERARRKAKAVCRSIRDFSFLWGDKSCDIGVSIGLVPLTAQRQDHTETLRMADSACYVAKQQGRNRVHVYQDQDGALTRRDGEVRWTQRIRRALRENRFRLYCQNIVPLGAPTGAPAHHEILLRMIDEDDNILRPAAFLGAAERYHLMPAIDRWVIASAIRLLGERRRRGEVDGVFSINISGQSLDDDEFLGFVVDQFDQGEVPPEMICFEITETTAATSLMVVQRFIAVLRGMGCQFALDDFGRGISSFAYLKNLDVDFLKIDGMFVRDLVADEVGHAMVESINNISHIMGVQTIAEFVETNEVLEKLVALGVDHVQGYQLGQPQPLHAGFRAVDTRH
jgi:diguanylate cyclase (GGDEF)-like protein/PAS domain S-box-containing protein